MRVPCHKHGRGLPQRSMPSGTVKDLSQICRCLGGVIGAIGRRCKASLLGLMAGLRGLGGVEYGFAKANAVIRIQLPGGEFVGMLRVRTERRRPRHSPAAPERLPAGEVPRGGGAERSPWRLRRKVAKGLVL